MTTSPALWQIACGESGRRYGDLFVQFDVMFLGPGGDGAYEDSKYCEACRNGRISKDEWKRVARFRQQVRGGDFVIARSGKTVTSIGIIVDDEYCHDSRFDDVHGWDVSHYRRVAWASSEIIEEIDDIQKDEPLFSHMKQIPTFTRADQRVTDKIKHALSRVVSRKLAELPPEPPPILEADQLKEKLFQRGVAYDSVERVCATIEKVKRLVRWYGESSFDTYRPTESEVVAHIILPIMLSLGWSEQLLAIEWGRRDMAAFLGTPTTRENCKLVVEAKDMSNGLQNVFEQARGYAEQLPVCDRILVTNGMRNYLYFANGVGENRIWPETQSLYFNLSKLREDHLCYPNTNAVDAIVALTPAKIAQQL